MAGQITSLQQQKNNLERVSVFLDGEYAFGVTLDAAQTLVMTARVMLGWVDPTELESADEAEAGSDEEAGV